MTRVLYGGKEETSEAWKRALLALRPGLDLVMPAENVPPESIDIILYEPSGPVKDMTVYRNIAAIQSLWAGVEALLDNDTLPKGPPLLRMVEDGLTEGMTDYITGHVLRAHLGVVRQQADQAREIWGSFNPPLSRDRHVGVIGLGALGQDAAKMLAKLRFRVSGWSRTQKDIADVRCLCGTDGFDRIIRENEIIVLLAPLTPETENLIDEKALNKMPHGVHIINAARGGLIDEDALLGALNSGRVATATLDVMRTEPLPDGHTLWKHPGVTITPHIASVTRPESAAKTVIEQIKRFETGKPFLHKVCREKGY